MEQFKLSEIIAYAIHCHSFTNHLYDGKPYAVHLAMVVSEAYRFIDCIPAPCHNEVIAACWLHDVIEDTRQTYNDVKKVAGEDVADIVYAVTNEKGKTRKERANESYYLGIRQTKWATYVKLCDRIANVRYSIETVSRMYEMYNRENDEFIKMLSPSVHYMPLVDELYKMFNQGLNLKWSVASKAK